jgi:hypothetical protein
VILTLITRPCTIITRTADTVNTYGDITKTETPTATLCELQPLRQPNRGEVEGGNLSSEAFNLYLLGSVALNADDAVIVDGEHYELVGDAAPRRSPVNSQVAYTRAVVRRLRDA